MLIPKVLSLPVSTISYDLTVNMGVVYYKFTHRNRFIIWSKKIVLKVVSYLLTRTLNSSLLKESRRYCLPAQSGIPTFTGSNGQARKAKFGPKRKVSKTSMSSSQLLDIMRSRNKLVPMTSAAETEEAPLEHGLFAPDRAEHGNGQSGHDGQGQGHADQRQMELLTDIRNFIAFQVITKSCIYTKVIFRKYLCK